MKKQQWLSPLHVIDYHPDLDSKNNGKMLCQVPNNLKEKLLTLVKSFMSTRGKRHKKRTLSTTSMISGLPVDVTPAHMDYDGLLSTDVLMHHCESPKIYSPTVEARRGNDDGASCQDEHGYCGSPIEAAGGKDDDGLSCKDEHEYCAISSVPLKQWWKQSWWIFM